MEMQVAVLGSGSGGNSMVLRCSEGVFLIDAGLSAKQLLLRLTSLGISIEDLTGIFLTHEHSDHTRGLNVFLKNKEIPVYANAMTKEALQWKMTTNIQWKIFQTGQLFHLGSLSIQSFSIPHDAAEPVGFVLENEAARFGILTDLGSINQRMKELLTQLDALFIEANYDEDLLENDTKRPWATKQRIASKHGHLSNTQTGNFITEIGCDRLDYVVLGHLSSDCNTGETAIATIAPLLKNADLRNIKLVCASQDQVTKWISFRNTIQATPLLTKETLSELSSATQGDLFHP